MKTTVLTAMVAVLVACGGGSSGEAQEWTATCSGSNGVATHDFGTTDLGVLGRVRAFELASACGDCGDAGAAAESPLPVKFEGSVGVAVCAGAPVTFVLEQ